MPQSYTDDVALGWLAVCYADLQAQATGTLASCNTALARWATAKGSSFYTMNW